MKGIILSGGTGSRLFPLTTVIGKQLLPVFDKPMIFYPLSTLIHAGVTQILLISTSEDISKYRTLLGDGSQLGLSIDYATQHKPVGIPQAISIASEFLAGENFWLILGDNMFHGPEFGRNLRNASLSIAGAHAYGYRVQNPSSFGVVEFSAEGNCITSLEEKPAHPKSNWAVLGLYHFDNAAVEKVERLFPSSRGELEMLDLLRLYQIDDCLEVTKISRGNAWFDLGTPEAILKASVFVHSIQTTQGLLVGSPEEAAINAGLISPEVVIKKLEKYAHTDYFLTLSNCLIEKYT